MASSYDIPASMAEANKWLKSMLGSDNFVKQWWNSPNIQFGGSTPLEVWALPGGDARVMKYIIYHTSYNI